MSSADMSKFEIPPQSKGTMNSLLRVPLVSPAVLGLIVLSTGGVIATDVLAILGHLSLGWACVLNTFLMYWQFTVVHDSIHRAASSNQSLNDWFGRIGIATFAPHVNLGIFRWAHVQHHRFTNGARDPDMWLHGSWWSMPLRWMFLDIGYLFFVLRHGDATAVRHLRRMLVNVVLTIAACAALVWYGWGMALLMLWFVPSRLTFASVGFTFFYLPHVKDDVPAERDITLASSIRLGHERLLSPLMQWHNYHLIHHLFPTMPCYRHEEAWQLLRPELQHRNLQVQHGLAFRPTVHLAK